MSWLKGMLADRRILLSLVSSDLRARYLTNCLGFLVFIQPSAIAGIRHIVSCEGGLPAKMCYGA